MRWSMGKTKAAVFPVPVWAMAMRSCPCMTLGMAAVWTGVGRVYPAFSMARRIAFSNPKVLNGMTRE